MKNWDSTDLAIYIAIFAGFAILALVSIYFVFENHSLRRRNERQTTAINNQTDAIDLLRKEIVRLETDAMNCATSELVEKQAIELLRNSTEIETMREYIEGLGNNLGGTKHDQTQIMGKILDIKDTQEGLTFRGVFVDEAPGRHHKRDDA